MQFDTTFLVPGLLGILFHVFVIKFPAVKGRAKAANLNYTFKDYVTEDWTVLIGNLIVVLMLIVGIDELINLKPAIKNYIKWLFFFVGVSGSSLFMYALSIADRKVKSVIDIKTNIADNIVPPVTPENKEGVQEIIDKDANR